VLPTVLSPRVSPILLLLLLLFLLLLLLLLLLRLLARLLASFSASQSHPVFGHRRCVHCTNDPPCANNKCYCSHDDSTKYCPKHFDLGNVVTMLSVESGVTTASLTAARTTEADRTPKWPVASACSSRGCP
jgi:hypothetical protein